MTWECKMREHMENSHLLWDLELTDTQRDKQGSCKWCSHRYMFMHLGQLGEQTYLRPYI